MIKKSVCTLILVSLLLACTIKAHRPSCGSPWHCYQLLKQLTTMSHAERVEFSERVHRVSEYGKSFYEIAQQTATLKKTRSYTSHEEYEITQIELNLYHENKMEELGEAFEQELECRDGSGRAYLDSAQGNVDSFNFGQLPFSCVQEIERAAKNVDYKLSLEAAQWVDQIAKQIERLEKGRRGPSAPKNGL